MNALAHLPVPRDFRSLVIHAAAASERLSIAYYDGTPEEGVSAAEEADFEARRALRGKLAEMGVDPRMLAKVIS